MDKDYQTKMEFVVRTHDDKGLYKDFYQFGHEILDDDTVQRIFTCIDNALKKKKRRKSNMSDDITQQYLEARYEHYLDTEGLSPKDAYTNAMQDADGIKLTYQSLEGTRMGRRGGNQWIN